MPINGVPQKNNRYSGNRYEKNKGVNRAEKKADQIGVSTTGGIGTLRRGKESAEDKRQS